MAQFTLNLTVLICEMDSVSVVVVPFMIKPA